MTTTENTSQIDLTKQAKDAIIESLESFNNLTVNHSNSYPLTIISSEVKSDDNGPIKYVNDPYNQFVVAVDTLGELRLSEVFDGHGDLLYTDDSIEISLEGYKTIELQGKLLVKVKETQ